VQVKDSAAIPQSATQAFTVSVLGSGLNITSTNLPGGQVQVAYQTTLTASGGTPPYTWSVTSGTLPPGLALTVSTGQISGTPSTAGAFGFIVQVRDSAGQTASASLTINVLSAPPPPPSGFVQPVLPTLPQATVDPNMPDTTGYAVVQVNAGGNIQTAIDNASCNPNGTIIKIQAGATFNGHPILLRNKTCAAGKWIIIRSDASDTVLPGVSNGVFVRAKPTDAPNMPTIIADQANVEAFRTEPGANHYRLMFLQIRPSTSYSETDSALISLGDGGSTQNTIASQPHDLIVDRCLVRGYDSPPVGARRGVELQCSNCAVVSSYISGMHQVGFDAQAIGGWNSTGPWLIDNNYLEAAGQGILFGGAGIAIPGAVPSDITVTRNYFFKPRSWQVGNASYAGTHWTVKQIFEMKMGVRVLIEGNVMENIWPDAQAGEGWQCYSSNSDNHTPQALCADVTFRYNRFLNWDGGFGGPTSNNAVYPVNQATQRIWIHDNLGTGVGGASARYIIFGSDDLIANTNGLEDAYFSHNTIITAAPIPSVWLSAEGIVTAGHTPFLRFAFHNNIFGTQGIGETANCRIGSSSTSDCWSGAGGSDSWFKNILYGHACGTSSNEYN